MTLLSQFDWHPIVQNFGPLGVIFALAVIGIVAGAKMVKGLILGTIEDARKERDYMREQRTVEQKAFIESLRLRDELMKDGFDEVLRELRSPRRK